MFSDRDYYRNDRQRGCLPVLALNMTMRLILINAVVFVLTGPLDAIGLFKFGALSSDVLMRPWSLVTYMFLHADFFHLLFNMYSLWLFGGLVENILGAGRFLRLYFYSGLIAAGLYLLCNWGEDFMLIGASGAVFGVMTAAALAYPNARILFFFIPMKLWMMMLVYLAIEIFSFHNPDNIAHLAHIGGALGGFLFMKRLGFHVRIPQKWKFWNRIGGKSGNSGNEHSNAQDQERQFTFDQAELNRILNKLAETGEASLTPEERQFLHHASEELKRNRSI